jgi:hypothetical protein
MPSWLFWDIWACICARCPMSAEISSVPLPLEALPLTLEELPELESSDEYALLRRLASSSLYIELVLLDVELICM